MTAETQPDDPARTIKTVLNVAWMAIVLGLVIEALLVIVAFTFKSPVSATPVIADAAQKVTWSVLVCVGLAFGTTAAKLRAQIMGGLGAISAPVAFVSARSVHKGLLDMLGGAAPGGGPSPLVIGSVKALEYAVLGFVLGMIAVRTWGGLKAHLTVGLACGVVFGGFIVYYSVAASPAPVTAPALLSRGINEILFPVGCALALYAGQAFGKRFDPGGK